MQASRLDFVQLELCGFLPFLRSTVKQDQRGDLQDL